MVMFGYKELSRRKRIRTSPACAQKVCQAFSPSTTTFVSRNRNPDVGRAGGISGETPPGLRARKLHAHSGRRMALLATEVLHQDVGVVPQIDQQPPGWSLRRSSPVGDMIHRPPE